MKVKITALGFVTILISLSTIFLLFAFTETSKSARFLESKTRDQETTISKLTEEGIVKEATISSLRAKIEEIKDTKLYKELAFIKDSLNVVKKLKDKIKSYTGQGVKTEEVSEKYPGVVDLILEQKFSEATLSAIELEEKLDEKLEEKREADRIALEALRNKYKEVIANGGYVRYTVQTESGSFLADILVFDLNKVKVITDTGADGNCKADCPLYPLGTFVARNGGFAGINGTYFCPSAYPQCESKKNSSDFPIYNTRLGKWINKDNISWNNRALIGFKGASGIFQKFAKNFSTGLSVEAAITMTPGLLRDGGVITGDYSLEAKERARSTRSSIGYNGSKVYVVIARGVTVTDLAYVQKAVGAKNALAFDGGGSVAFYYNGVYLIGPGRSLSNAIVFRYR